MAFRERLTHKTGSTFGTIWRSSLLGRERKRETGIGLAMGGVKSCTRAQTLKRGLCACAGSGRAGELLKEPLWGCLFPKSETTSLIITFTILFFFFFFFSSLIWEQNKTLHFTSTYFWKQAVEMLKYHLVGFPTHCKMVTAPSCSIRHRTVPNVNAGFLNSKGHCFHMGS